jgi:DNA repair protein RecN (Recombination protein N)
MLLELRIENLLLIERAELRLGPGLNAITGETGAGKTVLAHSLDLLLGGKAKPQIVRPGAEEAWVEGSFELPPGLLDEPELAELAARLPQDASEVVLGRRIGASGRTSAFVGGRAASAGDLRALGSRLIAFYGQHEHRRLTLASAQLEILDGAGGARLLEQRHRYRAAHSGATRLAAELAELREREGARERDLDLLRFELAEIEATSPDADEEEELERERGRLRHVEALRGGASGALAALNGELEEGGARAAVGSADASLTPAEGVDAELDAIAERLRAAAVELEDVSGDLRGYLDGIEAEPGRLEAVEERLEALDRLKRKHGGTIAAVLEHAGRCREQLDQLENANEVAEGLQRRIEAAEAERARLAAELTKMRRLAAKELKRQVDSELAELAMEGASLEVSLEAYPQGFGPAGAETAELLVATNPGMPVAPLKDAASGGELSRIMLAMTSLAGSAEHEQTLVFDEIDAGIGGNTARAVGERLRRLGEARQVICITHLPQVASQAGRHFRIEKRAGESEARATVELVAGDELVAEIVRMLGGERGDAVASRHAEELLKAA